MSGLGLVFLVLVAGFVWGGFLVCVTAMMRAESRKRSMRSGGAT